MLTVNTTEEGLGNDDGHIFAVALNVNTRSWNDTEETQEEICTLVLQND